MIVGNVSEESFGISVSCTLNGLASGDPPNQMSANQDCALRFQGQTYMLSGSWAALRHAEDSGREPEVSVSGTYALRTVNNRTLPYDFDTVE